MIGTGDELDSFADLLLCKSVVTGADLVFHIAGGQALPLAAFGNTPLGNYQKQISLQQSSLKRLWKLKPVTFSRKTVIMKK